MNTESEKSENSMNPTELRARAMQNRLGSVDMLDRECLTDWQDYILYHSELDGKVLHKRRCIEAIEALNMASAEESETWTLLKMHETLFGQRIFPKWIYHLEDDIEIE